MPGELRGAQVPARFPVFRVTIMGVGWIFTPMRVDIRGDRLVVEEGGQGMNTKEQGAGAQAQSGGEDYAKLSLIEGHLKAIRRTLTFMTVMTLLLTIAVLFLAALFIYLLNFG